MMAWENKNKELEQLSISAINQSMQDLKRRKEKDLTKEMEH